jgi:8-oxo-dGTP diphosphatase
MPAPIGGGASGISVDWAAWVPSVRCVLCFVVREGEVLLIRKKRGLGAGKINGPGGKIDPGETPLAAARRECREEIGVVPLGVREAGQLHFQFVDGLALHCVVFRADGCEGHLTETDEAVPLWTPLDAIPFDAMWQDDRHWFPWMLERRPFRGYFVFAQEAMLEAVLTGPSSHHPLPAPVP